MIYIAHIYIDATGNRKYTAIYSEASWAAQVQRISRPGKLVLAAVIDHPIEPFLANLKAVLKPNEYSCAGRYCELIIMGDITALWAALPHSPHHGGYPGSLGGSASCDRAPP